MTGPRPESYAPADAADLVADALAGILDGVPEVRDFFEILPRWDDAPREGAFCTVTAQVSDESVAGEDGSLVAPLVEYEVALLAAQGEIAGDSGFHAARAAAGAVLEDAPALRRAILARLPGVADAALVPGGREAGAEGYRYAATWRGSIQFSNNPKL